jgi:hypothetical protein
MLITLLIENDYLYYVVILTLKTKKCKSNIKGNSFEYVEKG